jgi:hypothetical protein
MLLIKMLLLIRGKDLILYPRQHVSLVRVVVEVTIKEVMNETKILNSKSTQRIAFATRTMDMI